MRQTTFGRPLAAFAILTTWFMFLAGCGKNSPTPEALVAQAPAAGTTLQPSQPGASAEGTESADIAIDEPRAVGGEVQIAAVSLSQDAQEDPPKQSFGTPQNGAATARPTLQTPSVAQLEKWNLVAWEPWQLLSRQPTKALAFAACSATSSDGNWLVLGGDTLTLWKMGSPAPAAILGEQPNRADGSSITAVAMAPNNLWFVTGDSRGALVTWNLNAQSQIASKEIYSTAVMQIAISDDGQEIATTSYQNEVSTWKSRSLEPTNKFAANGYTKLCYIGPEQLVVTGKTMEVWSPSSGEMIRTILDKGYPKSIARSDDRVWFAVASDQELKLIHSQDPTRTKSISGNFSSNELLEFSPDGKQLWSANGALVRAWDIENGKLLQAIDAFGPALVGIDFLPTEGLLRMVTEDGTIKLWGTIAAGEVSGLKPLHAHVALPEPASPQLANAAQLVEAIDLRTFPQPPNSQVKAVDSSMAMLDTPESIGEVKSFYRYLLDQRGWLEQPQNLLTPDYLYFQKGSMRLFLSLYAKEPSVTSVQIANLGNADARVIPKLDAAERKVIYEDTSSATYQVKTNLLTAEVELLKKLRAVGWIPYSRLNASRSQEKDGRNLEFIQNAHTLRVSIRPAIDDSTSLMVQYSMFVAQSNLPTPDDCDYIECDAEHSPALVAFTSLGLDACQEFYERVLPTHGWLAAERTESPQKDVRWLTFFRGQRELTLRLSTEMGGRTCIRTGEHAEQNSWQLAKVQSVDSAANLKPSSSKAKPGIEAADLPIYKAAEATSIKYEAASKQIEVGIPRTSHTEIVDFYAKIWGDQGWTEEPNAIRNDDYAFVTFSKDRESIELRVNSSASLNSTIYRLSDDGILWTKPLPMPNERTSYEAWLRKNQHPATLRLLEVFVKEMQAITK